MNEFSLQKQKMQQDKREQQNRRQPIGRQAPRSHSSSSNIKTYGATGSYSKDFAKISYVDPDMRRLATEGKGTTNAHNYQ